MLTEIIVRNFRSVLNNIDRMLFFLGDRFPPPGFCIAEVDTNSSRSATPGKKFSITEFMRDGTLWGVPKKRVSLERRKMRKYGSIEQYYKLLIPKKDLLVCVHCGHDHKRGHLCPNCYNKVMDETKQIQDRICEELKLDPVDQEVVVLYEGEKTQEKPEYWEGKRIIEMPKERPAWFSRNLMEKATTTSSDSKEVKPENLG